MPTLILYIGSTCHLCEQAKSLVYQVAGVAGWRVELVNIDENDMLREEYGMRIPVVAVSGGGEKGWPFTVGQVKRLMGL